MSKDQIRSGREGAVSMRRLAVFAALAGTIGCGQSAPPQQQIDVVGIRSELLVIGQAERQYLVSHSTYGTLDELQRENLLRGGADRRGYTFSVQVDGGQSFAVTASPNDPGKQGWPTLSMDQTMQVTER